MEGKSYRRNHEGDIMEEKSWRRNHEVIMEGIWRQEYPGGTQEASRKHPGGTQESPEAPKRHPETPRRPPGNKRGLWATIN